MAHLELQESGATPFDDFLVAILAGFAFLALHTEQGTTRVSDEGVFFRRWYGLRKCTIAWKYVRTADSSKVLKTITVFSAAGRNIVHMQWHVAPSTFEASLRRRLNDNFIQS